MLQERTGRHLTFNSSTVTSSEATPATFLHTALRVCAILYWLVAICRFVGCWYSWVTAKFVSCALKNHHVDPMRQQCCCKYFVCLSITNPANPIILKMTKLTAIHIGNWLVCLQQYSVFTYVHVVFATFFICCLYHVGHVGATVWDGEVKGQSHTRWNIDLYSWALDILGVNILTNNNSLYVANDTRYCDSYHGRRIGTRLRSVTRCHFQ